MNAHSKYIVLIAVVFHITNLFAQDRNNDTIDGGTVTVIKPYTPKIADAFKVKDIPVLNDSAIRKKKKIKYNIFSIPVASTFTPAKGKAADVDKEKSLKQYDNYASLGGGSYATLLGEIYINHAISRTEQVGGYFSHHSSSGNVKQINFDTNFYETGLNAYYRKQERNMSWNVESGFELQHFNWYGLPEQDRDIFDVGHSFYTAHIGGDITFESPIVKNTSLLFRHFGDDQDSGENRFVLKTRFTIPLAVDEVNTEVSVDYLRGLFETDYFNNDELDYGNITIGLKPNFRIEQEDLTLDLGLDFVYYKAIGPGEDKFFIYPNVTASYRLVDELLIAFGSIEGGLKQHSYYDFAQENPFVSPTLIVSPTDEAYKASIGIKGKLSNNMSYNVRSYYCADNDKALFTSNAILNNPINAYQAGNSFGITYDDLKTFAFGGALNIDVSRNFTVGLKADYYFYTTENESEAWNLPNIEASAFLNAQIDEHWYAGANLFFVGERKDLLIEDGGSVLTFTENQQTLKSYFDANAHVGYKVTERLSAFAKANNIGNQNYTRWVNYPVQGFQFLVGATYQFDF